LGKTTKSSGPNFTFCPLASTSTSPSQNLVIDAQQAIPQGGTLHVNAVNEEITEKDKPALKKPGKYLMISIKDYGVGIPAEHLSKIFDPYLANNF
jgi:signal transduction histidine kinase